MRPALLRGAIAAVAASFPLESAAEVTVYGTAHLSVDYLDVDRNAAWGGAVRGPFFDPLSFIIESNKALNDAGYTAVLPPPRELDTVIGDVLFGTYPFESLDPITQQRILDALDNALPPRSALGGWDVVNRESRLGFKGSEDLGNGLKAIWQMEFGVDIADTGSCSATGFLQSQTIGQGDTRGDCAGGSVLSARNAYVGLAGGWGTVLAGRHDTPYKLSTARLDLFEDTLADYNQTVGFDDIRPTTLLYASPNLWGLQLTGAVIPGQKQDYAGRPNPSADGLADGWSVALDYSWGPLYASAAYEFLGSSFWETQDAAYDMFHAVFAEDDTKWRVGLGLLDWNGFSLSGIYESRDNVYGMPKLASYTMWQVQGGYAFGNNLVKAMYGAADLDICADPYGVGFRYTCSYGKISQLFGDLDGRANQRDKQTWALGLDHRLSRRTTVYALYTVLDDENDDADWSGVSLGLMHKF